MYKQTMRRTPVKALVISLTIAAAAHGQLPSAQPGAAPGARIRVLEGDGAINSIRLHRGHDPSVQVLDAAGNPAPAATVIFLLPAVGPSGTFGDSGLSLTAQTDARGIAVGKGLRPNRIAGQFRIRVTASWRGEAASTTLTQTNAEPLGKSSNSKWIAIVALVGGAVVGGAVAATHGGKSSSTASTDGTATTGGGVSAGTTIVPGSPSLGPPR